MNQKGKFKTYSEMMQFFTDWKKMRVTISGSIKIGIFIIRNMKKNLWNFTYLDYLILISNLS